jgi:chromosome segregation ATPase
MALSLQASITDESGKLQDIICPCCTRSFNREQKLIEVFRENLLSLGNKENSPLLQFNNEHAQKARAAKKNYQIWRSSINEIMSDLMEHTRITIELGGLDATVNELESSASANQAELDNLIDECSDTQIEVDDYRSLVELTKRCVDEAGKIARKTMRISQKTTDLPLSMTSTINTNNRSLRDVEREVEGKMKEKDNLMNKINDLNKVMSVINTNISNISTQVSC